MRKKQLGTILGALAVVGLVAAAAPSLTSVTGAAEAPATVTVVHGIPSVGNVDVCAGGSTALLSDVPFGAVPDSNEQNPFQVITNLVDLPTATTPTTAAPTTTTMPAAGAAAATNTSPSFTG